MSTTTPTATGSHIGTCVKCGTRYFAATDADRGYCGCRSNTPCNCSADVAGHTHPKTSIKWGVVKSRRTATACSDVCLSAKSNLCACNCAGENHGKALGLSH